MLNGLILSAAFTFGACIGSFLNVCICRLPESQSIVAPGSKCPGCNTPIRFYDNIPIISYIFLKGKCRKCKESISVRYPLVELLTGLVAITTTIKFGMGIESLIYFIFIAALIVTTFIDIDHKIIPDSISLPGIPIGVLSSFAIASLPFKDSLLGVLIGGGILFLIAWSYQFFTGKEGMGGGDIKLLAMIGAFTGWQGVFFTIFVSSVTGTIVGVTLMLIARKSLKFAVPFGPFLAIGAVLYVFFGPEIISWYYYGLYIQ
jgi:leader peptidase (prepilin peptidase) / N-methyltransferase